jgi:hypothetical protein
MVHPGDQAWGGRGRATYSILITYSVSVLVLVALLTNYYRYWSLPIMFRETSHQLLSLSLSLSLATATSATLLYVTSYAGMVTTLNLTLPAGGYGSTGELEAISTSTECSTSPSWLTLDHANSVLYCLNEGLTPPGSLSSFKTSEDGSLVLLDQLDVLLGPVSSVIYGEDRDGLAVAH